MNARTDLSDRWLRLGGTDQTTLALILAKQATWAKSTLILTRDHDTYITYQTAFAEGLLGGPEAHRGATVIQTDGPGQLDVEDQLGPHSTKQLVIADGWTEADLTGSHDCIRNATNLTGPWLWIAANLDDTPRLTPRPPGNQLPPPAINLRWAVPPDATQQQHHQFTAAATELLRSYPTTYGLGIEAGMHLETEGDQFTLRWPT